MPREFIIAPRRNEPIVGPGGFPTTRFSEYVERSATTVNTTEVDVTEIEAAVADVTFIEFWRS